MEATTLLRRFAAGLAASAFGSLALLSPAPMVLAQPTPQRGVGDSPPTAEFPRQAESPTRLPRVASINLCADQLVVELAAPEQIVSLSWLASDPEESMLAAAAARYPTNHGGAEELVRIRPDVVIAGTFTAQPAREMLERLGVDVLELAPAESVDAIITNLEAVANAIGRPERGAEVVAGFRAALEAADMARPARAVGAVVLRPGNFTVGAASLADALIERAGLVNIAARDGLDRWGSLSLESLLERPPELLILSNYRRDAPSLANAVLEHPALVALERRVATVVVPSRLWTCGLPQSVEAVTRLERAARAVVGR